MSYGCDIYAWVKVNINYICLHYNYKDYLLQTLARQVSAYCAANLGILACRFVLITLFK